MYYCETPLTLYQAIRACLDKHNILLWNIIYRFIPVINRCSPLTTYHTYTYTCTYS